MNRPRPIEVAALLFFLLLSIVLVAPSLFSASVTVCGGDCPDTWLHMWAFWRAGYAASGQDAGILTSHALTYPDALHEPIAVFDPLMPLFSIPFQLVLPHMTQVFDLMVLLGLTFTAMASYALAVRITGRRTWSVIAGVIAAMNPFVYRQIYGGYIEYAWWGIIPLCFWLYLRAVEHPGARRIAAYVVSLLALFLWSIYCAAFFLVLAAADLLAEGFRKDTGKPCRLRRVISIQSIAVLALLPLMGLWCGQLSAMHYKGISLGKPFPLQILHEAFTEDANRPSPEEAFLPWRTLAGSVDLSHALSLGRRWTDTRHRLVLDDEVSVPVGFFQHDASESVFGREWLLVLILALFALCNRPARRQSVRWLLLAGGFLLLAMGPFLIWSGHLGAPLPYAALYRWLPGFSRFAIPGRFFLGTILCMSILAVRGSASLAASDSEPRDHFAALCLSAVIFLWFMATGPERLTLPATQADVAPVYEQIGREPGSFALLELPVAGDLDYRMYAQAIHKRAIYKGLPATEWTDENSASGLENNALVQFLDSHDAAAPSAPAASEACEALRNLGFRYLLLHADGYRSRADFLHRQSVVTELLGTPVYADPELICWLLAPRDS